MGADALWLDLIAYLESVSCLCLPHTNGELEAVAISLLVRQLDPNHQEIQSRQHMLSQQQQLQQRMVGLAPLRPPTASQASRLALALSASRCRDPRTWQLLGSCLVPHAAFGGLPLEKLSALLAVFCDAQFHHVQLFRAAAKQVCSAHTCYAHCAPATCAHTL